MRTAQMENGQPVKKNMRQTVLWILAVLLPFLTVMVQTCRMTGGRTRVQTQLLMDGWYYMEDGERHLLELPGTVSVDGDPFVVYYDGLTADMAGQTLTTRGAQYGLQIALDGEVLYEYRDPYFKRNMQMKAKQYCDAVIPMDYEGGGRLTLTYESPGNGRLSLPEVRIGTGREVLLYHLKEAAVTFGIAFIFVIFSVISLGSAMYLHWKRIDDRRFVDTALFLLVCSVWFVTDTALFQELSGCPSLICEISFYAFMLFAIPMVSFAKHIRGMEKYGQLDWLAAAFYLNAALQGLIHYWLGIEFIDMLFVTHLLLVVGVAMVTVLLIREYRQNPGRDVRQLLIAYAALSFSGVLALFLYWLLEIPYYGSIFEFGILIFVVIILANVEIAMAENVHYKTEMQVYQRLAREDWMTGMENRQPFEEEMTRLQNASRYYQNVALVFMDLNQLKQTNDEFGHAAGDELIIAASACIQNTFAGAGKCYRIGGDEFAAILLDPASAQREWFARLDQEIWQYNKEGRYYLSIARGWSDLRREDGGWKTVSDWKYEADYRMYENKGGMRRI